MKEASIGFVEEHATGEGISENTDCFHSWKNGLVCALLVGACLLATYPIAEMGVGDDWSYAKTALDFLHTGHILYNGWASPLQGWQALWGALFIKLFGFSFTTVRLSMLPIAMASIYLFHQILVRFGIASRLAVFGTLTLGLSPLFVPLAASFMTDIPGLFAILLCIDMCQRAVAAPSDRAAVLWLISAALLNLVAGTARQVAWLGLLVMVPSTAWFLRRKRGVPQAVLAIWLASFGAILWLMHWFSQQPYSLSETAILSGPIHWILFAHFVALVARAFLCLLLLVLPVLAAWLPTVRRLSLPARTRTTIFLLVCVIAYCILIKLHDENGANVAPWIAHILGEQGLVPIASTYMLGVTPVSVAPWLRIAISILVLAAGFVFAEWMKSSLPIFRRAQNRLSWHAAAWVLGPITLSYLALLSPRAFRGFLFDRYLFCPMVVAVIFLLMLYQQEVGINLPIISWTILAVFACYTLAATHDWFALDRARVEAADRITASGIPRTAIQGGLEYDGWTQIQDVGYVNLRYVHFIRGAYNSNTAFPPVAPKCRIWYFKATPAVQPKYFLTFEPMDCLAPSTFPSVGYVTWLPPYHRKVYVQQLPAIAK